MSGPNLASVTSTRIESAAKHQIPVKVSYEHMLSWVGFDQVRLQKEKMSVCLHKDDLAIGCSKPVRKNENGRGNQRNRPYPVVVSTLASMEQSAKSYLIYLLHNPKTFAERDRFVNFIERRMDHWEPTMSEVCKKQIIEMPEFYFVGVSVGLAYAHPLTGDNVCTAMIGGLITILNGAFDIETGDTIHWIWDIEVPCFDRQGKRHDPIPENTSHAVTQFLSHNDPKFAEDASRRKQFNERGNGVYTNQNDGGTATYNGKRLVAFPKALRPGTEGDFRLGDKLRVFGRAMSRARPFEQVDILLSRQSL
jgi:hypothetical protein